MMRGSQCRAGLFCYDRASQLFAGFSGMAAAYWCTVVDVAVAELCHLRQCYLYADGWRFSFGRLIVKSAFFFTVGNGCCLIQI